MKTGDDYIPFIGVFGECRRSNRPDSAFGCPPKAPKEKNRERFSSGDANGGRLRGKKIKNLNFQR